MQVPDYQTAKRTYLGKGYHFSDNGPYDLNIFGIRSGKTQDFLKGGSQDQSGDSFNDLICVAYREGGLSTLVAGFMATTDPGTYWLRKPMGLNGTAILAPGQYRSAYALGMHGAGAWRHLALRQVGTLQVYRDNNLDDRLDFDKLESARDTYIDIHASQTKVGQTLKVGRYSAGCQVFKTAAGYLEFIELCRQQLAHNMGKTFTYTLFNETDFIQ